MQDGAGAGHPLRYGKLFEVTFIVHAEFALYRLYRFDSSITRHANREWMRTG